ncbi:uncharacterized protein LOC133320871 [Danaus plexippus]|uniref:uncharacterized protein LOC133320871 n=1 Tax=Danaus plexippus TaxID=13037 RepID=UPI002AB18A10|nr:uncharacterized protein LOC133320871 [Danaus plexippus]
MLIKYIFLSLIPIVSMAPKPMKQVFMKLDPARFPDLNNIFMDCTAKTGIDLDNVQRIINWNFKNDEIVKKYLYCLTKNSGYGDDNGHFVKEKMLQIVGNHPSRSDLANTIDECNKEMGSNNYDTVYKTVICFRNKSPILFKT